MAWRGAPSFELNAESGGVQNVGPGFDYTHAITLIQKCTERLSKFISIDNSSKCFFDYYKLTFVWK